MKTIIKYLLVIVLLLFGKEASAGNVNLGVFNSPKGFGLELITDYAGREFNIITVYADTYGVLEGRCLYPGVKFNYTRGHNISNFKIRNAALDFYAGPGVTIGYARQFEPYIYKDYRKYLTRNYGAVACLSGTAGCRLGLSDNVSLDLNWTIEAGVHMRLDENRRGLKLGLYKVGLLTALYPQLIISIAF